MNLGDKIAKAVNLLQERKIIDFEVYGSSIDTIRAESKDYEAGYLNRSAESGISIRILNNGAMGFAYGAEATRGLIDSAVSSARYQFKDEFNQIPANLDNYIQMDLFDTAVSGLKAEECINQAISLEKSARDCDSRIQQVRKAAFSRTITSKHVINSNGVDISSTSTYVSASVMAMAKDSDDTQSGYDFDFSHYLSEINVPRVGVDAARKATDMLFARKIKTMKIPVVFDNVTTAQMLDFISDAFVGENVIKGKSYLKDKLGKTCFSPTINLSDNPLDIHSSNACPFDGEGVPSQNTPLVKDGTVLAFIYDSYWGKIADKSSTGNSVRGGYTSAPHLGIRHLCLEPGNEDLSQKLAGLKQVLKITDIMGMHTANPITGEFSVGVNGLLLEKNNVLYPVREAALSGNIYEMFSRVIAVGDDARAFGNIFCPSILIDAMDISSQ